jgi:hypothetical protein
MQAVSASQLTAGASLLTGQGSVLTSDDVDCSACEEPTATYMPQLRRSYTITKRLTRLVGNHRQNALDLLIQVKDDYKASGVWEVFGSSNGTITSTGDLWTNILAMPVGAWLGLRNKRNGVQMVIEIWLLATWAEVRASISPSGAFTGGGPTTIPTAPDSYVATGGSDDDWLGTGPNVDGLEFRAWTWVSTDGMVTRTLWWLGGNLLSIWEFCVPTNPAGTPGSWVPFYTVWWSGGNSALSPVPPRCTLNQYQAFLRMVRTPANLNLPMQIGIEEWGTSQLINTPVPNQATGQYFWMAPCGILYTPSFVSPQGGVIGYCVDQWWVGQVGGVPVFNDGDTADNYQWIFVGQQMLPWDGTPNPPTGGAIVTVDRPAASFYGRSVL